jgi:hypothetical protein
VLWPGEARLCLTSIFGEPAVRRVATGADLDRWGVDLATAKARLSEGAAAQVAKAVTVPIAGMEPASWLRLQDPNGWAAAGVLRPELLAERLGGLPIRVAVPAAGVLVAWRTEDPEVDRVMAVGVRELHEQQGGPVTDHVWQWDGRSWTPFGRAVQVR